MATPIGRYRNISKHKVKNAVAHVGRFEEALAEEARRRGLDGVVCGHIHHAEMRSLDGVTYCNDGDWVESCTALVEHRDGRLEILDWLKQYVLDAAEGGCQRGLSKPPAAFPWVSPVTRQAQARFRLGRASRPVANGLIENVLTSAHRAPARPFRGGVRGEAI